MTSSKAEPRGDLPTGHPDAAVVAAPPARDSDASASAPETAKDRHGRLIPGKYAPCLELLDYLADQNNHAFGRFEAERSGPIDLAKIRAHGVPAGVEFFDVNQGGLDGLESWTSIERQISERKGGVFEQLAHLGHIYAMPYPQYSTLSFEPVSHGVLIRVASFYELTFHLDPEACRLTKCAYVKVQEE